MAFGFERERGKSARGYVNRANPDFEYGQRLSRRQYDAYVGRLGRRSVLPGTQAIAETDRLLRDLAAQLEADEIDAADAILERAELLAKRREIEAVSPRRAAQGKGQRRYNAMLDAYVKAQRQRGHNVGKRAASQSAEFKAIMADFKGKPNKRGNPRIADENRFRRKKALDALNGDKFFRDQYESLYGGRAGHGFRINATGRSVRGRRSA